MRTALLDSLNRFLDTLGNTLQRLAPAAKSETIRAVSHGVSSCFVNLDSLTPLSPPSQWRQDLKQAALLLVGTLETPA